MNEFSDIDENLAVDVLLSDYAERGQDYRRQIVYYPKIVFALLAVISSSLAWVFGSPDPAGNYWMLPIAVIVCEVIAAFAVYIYWSAETMHTYLVEIEAVVCAKLPRSLKLHSIDEDSSPEIGFGYHYWSRINPKLHSQHRRKKLLRYGSALFVAGCYLVIMAAMWMQGVTSEAFSQRSIFRLFLSGAAVLLPSATIGGLIWVRLRVLSRQHVEHIWAGAHLASRDEQKNPGNSSGSITDSGTLLRLLSRDYAERNADYRSLIDNYAIYLTLVLSILAGAVSVYLAGGNEWVFAFAPFMIVTIPFFMILHYRTAKPLRQYMSRVESVLDGALSSTFNPVHWLDRGKRNEKRFRFGFIGIVRERHWQRTTSDKPKVQNAVVVTTTLVGYFAILIWMCLRSFAWVGADHPDRQWLYWAGLVVMVLVIGINVALFLDSKTVAHEDDNGIL